ncbi:MAG: DUF302 domain-containing protein [Bacteroidales bacterium]
MRALKALPLAAAVALATVTAYAADAKDPVPEKLNFPSASKKPHRANTVLAPISPEARAKFAQSTFAGTPLSLRDLINLLTYKVPVKEGVSYDDVVSSMKARANKLNFKFVGSNAIYKDVAALSGQSARKIEVFNFCDAAVARELLDYSLEFVVFLPCRIAAVEDADGKLWLMTLDWNVNWLDTSPNPDRLPESLRTAATKLHDSLVEIMRAGAEGEL